MTLLDRLLRRPTPQPAATGRDVLGRRFDAAAGRRWNGEHIGNVPTETLFAGPTVAARARYFVANNPWASASVNALTAALVGPGIRAAGTPEATAAFDDWARVADVEGRTDLWGLMTAAVRGMIVDGESFLLIEPSPDGPNGLPQGRLLPAEMVDPTYTVNLPSGAYVIGGVEFDARGTRVAYHVFRQRPDMLAASTERVRIPAADMLHLCRPIGAGQVRGVSWFSPVLLRLRELDVLEDALAKGVSVAALHAGFLVDQNGTASGEPFDDASEVSLEPGIVRRLPPGFDIKFSSPQHAQQTGDFVAHRSAQSPQASGCRRIWSTATCAGRTIPASALDSSPSGSGSSRSSSESSFRSSSRRCLRV